jgi:hypothetical protein
MGDVFENPVFCPELRLFMDQFRSHRRGVYSKLYNDETNVDRSKMSEGWYVRKIGFCPVSLLIHGSIGNWCWTMC